MGRVIARPFVGTPGNFTRTVRRHDFSLQPPKVTMLDQLCGHGYDVRSVGKIIDIFAEKGIKEYVRTTGNEDGINKTIAYMKQDFEGLCFTNLVDYKAVLTPTNRKWNVMRMYLEMQAEKAAYQKNKA